MNKILRLCIPLLLIAACTPQQNVEPSPVPAKPTQTLLPVPQPTIAEYLPPTTTLPKIFPQGAIDLQSSAPFGKGTISQLAWSPDGAFIAVGGSTGIRFYSADTLDEIRFIPTSYLITSIAFSPDGTTLASGSADLNFSSRANWRRSSPWVSQNNFVQIWEVETGNLIATLEAGFSYVTTVAFSPDGTLLASGSMYPDDNAVRIWKLDSVFQGDTVPWQLHKEHTRGIFGIDFSPDGSMLLSGSGDNSARLWDVPGNRMSSILKYWPEAKVKVFAVDYSPVIGQEGQQLVALAGADFLHNTPTALLEIWDTASGKLVFEMDGHTSSLDSVSFNPDGTLLASGGSYPDNKIKIWDVQSGEPLQVLEGHASGVRSLTFSPDGWTLASSGWDGRLNFWDVGTGRLILSNDKHTSVIQSAALSPDGRIVATGGDEGFIRLWNTDTGQKQNTLDTHSSRVTSLEFTPDGTKLIAGTDEPGYSLQIWDVSAGELVDSFSGHTNFIQVMALSPDGNTLASGGALGDNSVRIWDLAEGGSITHVIEGHTRSVKSLAFSSDGQTIASGDGTGKIRLVETATGQVTQIIDGQDCAITALVFDNTNGTLVSGGCHGSVRVWDIESGKMLQEIKGLDETVSLLSIDNRLQEWVIGYANGATWLWNPIAGETSVKIEGGNNNIRTLRSIEEKIFSVMDSGGGLFRLWTFEP